MTPPDQCPFCGSDKVLPAEFKDKGEGYTSLCFREVKEFPWWKYGHETRDVSYDRSAHLCFQCGKLWTQFNLNEARKLIQEHGSDQLKAQLPTNTQGQT